MFEVWDKDRFEITKIYGVRSNDGRVEFLIYYKNEFIWNHSSYFEPIDEREKNTNA